MFCNLWEKVMDPGEEAERKCGMSNSVEPSQLCSISSSSREEFLHQQRRSASFTADSSCFRVGWGVVHNQNVNHVIFH